MRGRAAAAAFWPGASPPAVDSLDDALDLLEMQALTRALQPSERKRPEHWIPTYIVIAMTCRYDLTRLQVVLEL